MTTRSAFIFIMVLLAAASLSSLAAHAQVSARPDPGDPETPALSDKPDSALKGYKPFREQPVRSWKDANQEVADNPGMGSMANMPGMNMPGMGASAPRPGEIKFHAQVNTHGNYRVFVQVMQPGATTPTTVSFDLKAT